MVPYDVVSSMSIIVKEASVLDASVLYIFVYMMLAFFLQFTSLKYTKCLFYRVSALFWGDSSPSGLMNKYFLSTGKQW